MNDYISKPIEPGSMFAELAKWISPSPMSPEPAKTLLFPGGLPGIDVESGLARLMGKEGLYKKLLINFFRKNESTPEEIRAALMKNDPESAITLTHTIKGAASTLSATEVYETARDLETAIRKKSTGYDQPLSNLDKAVKNGLKAVEKLQ
jgi:two-component system sensor histidine kinase/response regulator